MSDQDYPLGYSDREARRLADQASYVGRLTEDLLRRAGLRPGMHVLDLGSGVGDVALLAAKMVGSEGAVLGVEKAPSSVETARRRATELSFHNVAFEEADLADFTTDRKFDAIVGRFVLLYVPDSASLLRRLAAYLRPGAIVAFQELDIGQIAQEPPSELFLQARGLIHQAFAAAGADLQMGTRLFATFRQAGLPTPDMLSFTPVGGGPAFPGYEQMVEVLRSLLPLIERTGVANSADIGIDTLAARLREDALAHNRVLFLSRIVDAWTRIG